MKLLYTAPRVQRGGMSSGGSPVRGGRGKVLGRSSSELVLGLSVAASFDVVVAPASALPEVDASL